ncbi:plastocyanin/azurin family copper-binding protein [Natrononativus amylolyticus]|uniref:plastocyanin/azurin family copper-binding protein n=1 Tax=Natrononativus amylolyticus TaxID=2963434 RepID=UPI0020CC2E06|nr:plastocyanin/azurin family copper-binding protein [Natrononativus amylolyticus]
MRLSRRGLLVATGASIAVAGCTGNGEDPGDDEEIDPNGADDDEEVGENDDENGDDENDEADETVLVGPDGDHRFDPDVLEIEPGVTVEFVWEDSGHNVAVEGQPEGADWEGVPEIADEGETHEHTFEDEGRYEYVCEPHADDGMVGEILVGEAAETDDDDGDDAGGY